MCCCCAESGANYTLDEVYLDKLDRAEVASRLEDMSNASTWILRVCGFLLHFLGIYLIFYPFILLIGMIPYLGAVGVTILIFFAFILALMSFLFIIACSWICARPFLAFVIYGFIFVLFFVGKTERDSFQDANNNSNGYNGNNPAFSNNSNQVNGKGYDNHNTNGINGKNKFLKKFY